jgi:fatty-acyl-CoA synthase
VDTAIRRQTLADLLRRSAKRFPHKTAIECGSTRWSFAEFDGVTDRLAAGLSRLGVAKGTRVAVLARNSHGFAALRFALARLGAVLVPINFMLKAEEVAYILRHAGAVLMATDTGLAELARSAAALDTQVRQFIWLPSEEATQPVADMTPFDALAERRDTPPPVDLKGEDLAQIVYTSGTESMPKGAMLTHDAVIWQYASCAVDASIAAGDIMLHALPLYHCAQLDVFLGPMVYVGGTSIVTARPTPENLLPLIAKYRITSFFAPPTVWISLLRSPLFEQTDLSSLRKGYYGASIVPVEVLREMARRLPDVGFWNLYGQTEIAPLATMLGPEDQLRKPGSCGRAVLNVETRSTTPCATCSPAKSARSCTARRT